MWRSNGREEPSVGIDVSKSALDVSLYPSGNTWQVEYSPPCVTGLAEELADLVPTVVVVEATGGLEMSLTAVLGVAGLPVAVVNPKRVRDFARATGRLAKTDILDAQVLAQFGAMVRPKIRPLPDAARQDLLTELNVSLPGVHSHPCHPSPTKGKALRRELYAFYLGLSRSSGGNPARNTRELSGITS